MKRQILISMSALCMLAACTPSEKPEIQEPSENVIHFTATLAPKGENPQSKAITTGTEGGKEVLNVAWAVGEEIAVYYQTSVDPATATATVQSVTNGVATITADLTGAIDGGSVSLVYPASLHNGTGGIDETALLNNQKGTLTDISTNFDAAIGTGTITVSGSDASVSGAVSMENRVCICKFSFTYKYAIGTVLTLNKLNSLTIKTAAGDYTVSPESPATTGDVYLAMLPCSGANFAFIANASFTVPGEYIGGTSNFMAFPAGVSLTAGKFYRNLPVALTMRTLPTGAALRDLSAGSITANNGDIIWQSNGAATANTITIAAGASVTLGSVNIEATSSAGITCSGNATINIEGTNTVMTTTTGYSAIMPGGSGTTLAIQGSGSLTATGTNNGAGIGTGSEGSGYGTCGNIVISSSTVTANGGKNGAGIGSGLYGNCGDITISGGTVTANGGDYGAGIGGGKGGSALLNNSVCGAITISGGTVTATGGKYGAGIGSGSFGKFGSISITDGIASVTANILDYSGDQVPIGKGGDDKGSGSVTVDGVANWAGAETTHLNFTATNSNRTWTLTHK